MNQHDDTVKPNLIVLGDKPSKVLLEALMTAFKDPSTAEETVLIGKDIQTSTPESAPVDSNSTQGDPEMGIPKVVSSNFFAKAGTVAGQALQKCLNADVKVAKDWYNDNRAAQNQYTSDATAYMHNLHSYLYGSH